MFIYALFARFAHSQTGDLTPPFYANTRNRIGYWEISNTTQVKEDFIVFSQSSKGGIWNSLPIPYGEWSFSAAFEVEARNGNGGFGVWLIEEHKASGSFYGGPQNFKGAAFIGAVVGDELRIKNLQSKGEETFKELKGCDFKLKIVDGKARVNLTVHVLEKELVMECLGRKINKVLSVDLSNTWIGITGMSDDEKLNINFLGFKFDEDEYVEKHRENSQQQYYGKQSLYQRKMNSNFRNSNFRIMSRELDAFHDNKPEEKNIINVLDSIDEFTHALEEVETYSDLNSFIRRTLIPYVQGWQKRTFKIVENSQRTKELISQSFNQTQGLLYIFNNSIHESINKTDRKINFLTEVINENYSELNNIFKPLSKESNFLIYAIYISILEVILILCFYLTVKIPYLRETLKIV